jgi:hypothetical protein
MMCGNDLSVSVVGTTMDDRSISGLLGWREGNGGLYWDRTSDPFHVKEVLYR